MKTLKFFLMAVVAFAFFACTPQETGVSFSLVYGYEVTEEGEIIPNTGKEIKNGDVIDVTMEHFDKYQNEMVAHVLLTNNASSTKKFTMNEVRNYDYLAYKPSLCVLALGADYMDVNKAIRIVRTWIATEFEGGRHEARVKLIQEVENENMK